VPNTSKTDHFMTSLSGFTPGVRVGGDGDVLVEEFGQLYGATEGSFNGPPGASRRTLQARRQCRYVTG
jgi:hypothetical protein